MNFEAANKVILYMYEHNRPVDLAPALIELGFDLSERVSIINEFQRLKLVHSVNRGVNTTLYELTVPVSKEIKAIYTEQKHKLYQYFLDVEVNNIVLEKQAKWWESENARLQFEGYPRLKRQAFWALLFAGLAVAVSIVTLLIGK